jgi:hypothetical protein
MNINKVNRELLRVIESSDYSTKIKIFMSTKQVGADFDSYEKNYTYTKLNPLTIVGYVSDISAEALVYKQYGLAEVGAKEIICKEKYAEWFRKCISLEINGDTYQVYKENVGNRFLITKLPFQLIKVVVTKVK